MPDKTEARLALEARADALELKYPGNIGDEKLQGRIEEAEAEVEAAAKAEAQADAKTLAEEEAQKAAADKAEAEAAAKAEAEASAKAQAEEEARKAKAQAEAEAAAKASEKPFLTVTGPAKGFWRCGMRFGADPVSFGVGDLTEDQLTALVAEPKLKVTGTGVPAE